MSAASQESNNIYIKITDEAVQRLFGIIENGKTPIIKIEDTIYHPMILEGAPYIFIDSSNRTSLFVYEERSLDSISRHGGSTDGNLLPELLWTLICAAVDLRKIYN